MLAGDGERVVAAIVASITGLLCLTPGVALLSLAGSGDGPAGLGLAGAAILGLLSSLVAGGATGTVVGVLSGRFSRVGCWSGLGAEGATWLLLILDLTVMHRQLSWPAFLLASVSGAVALAYLAPRKPQTSSVK